jgi:hypothetical protein
LPHAVLSPWEFWILDFGFWIEKHACPLFLFNPKSEI